MKKTDAEVKALEVGLGFFEELKVVASPPHIVDSGASVIINKDYEKGFVDGMLKMTESAVHRAVEGMALKELTDEKITAISKEIFKDYKNFHHYQIDFARAVIKEVSEK
jgi:hypothetical protein